MIAGRTFWITGATGCLGAEMTRRLETLGARPVPLVLDGYPMRPTRAAWRATADPFAVHTADDLDKLPPPDVVIHLHWRVDRTLPVEKQKAYEIEWNLKRPAFIWERLVSSSCTRFLNVSSLSVYSHRNEGPVSADTEPRPATPYGEAKLASEQLLDATFANTACGLVHVRLGPVSAAGEHPSRLLAQLYESAFNGKAIRVNAGHHMFWLFIDEAVDLLIQAAAYAQPGRYLVAGPPVDNEELARLFEQIAAQPLHAESVDLAPDVPDLECVSDAASLSTEWTRHVSPEEAIRRIIKERTAWASASNG